MGSLACCLCDLEIAVEDAQMEQFRLHIKKDHDILEEQEAAMALTFLTSRERRELWGMVEDRRNTFLYTGRLDLFKSRKLGESKEEDSFGKEEDMCGKEIDMFRKDERRGWILNDINVKKENVKNCDITLGLKASIQKARFRLDCKKKKSKYVSNSDDKRKLFNIKDELSKPQSEHFNNRNTLNNETVSEIARLITCKENERDRSNENKLFLDLDIPVVKEETKISNFIDDIEPNNVQLPVLENNLDSNILILCSDNEIDLTTKVEPFPSFGGRDVIEDIKDTIICEDKEQITEKESISSMCELCYITTSDKIALNNHINKVHTKDKEGIKKSIKLDDWKYECKKCPLKFLSQNKLDGHTCLRRVYCQLCLVSFKTYHMFRRHKINVHKGSPDELKAFKKNIHLNDLKHKCESCLSSFLTENILLYHKKKKHGHKKKKHGNFPCILCQTVYRSRNSYKAHTKKHHKGKYEASLISQGHANNIKMQFKCLPCNKNLLTAAILSYHTRFAHKENFPREKTCRLCHMSFKNITKQRDHVRKYHSTKEELQALQGFCENIPLNHNCPFCPMKFFTNRILDYHTNELHRYDDWLCNYCKEAIPKTKNRNTSFKFHMKNKHGLIDYGVEDN